MSWLGLRGVDVCGLSAGLAIALAVTGCDSEKKTKDAGPQDNELPDAAAPEEEPDAAAPEEEPDAAAPVACTAPTEMCGETCVDTQTDVAHCGECGNACTADQTCEAGSCMDGAPAQFAGIQKNLAIAALAGWTQCHVSLYKAGPPLTEVLAPCFGSNLLLGCRLKDADTLLVAAHAPRADAMFDVGDEHTTHEANGAGWYFSDNASWGFAPAGAPVERDSCDIVANEGLAEQDGASRLCWHTEDKQLSGGYRCGDVVNLNGSAEYERVIFHTP